VVTRHLFAFLLLAIALPTDLRGQSQVAAEPIVGLRENRPSDYAFQHALVVVEPGHAIVDATVLVEGTSITAVGTDVEIPAGFMTIDCTGKSIYAGLIDAWGETEVPKSTSQAAYWNSNVTPERSAADVASKAADQAAKFRSAGFTTRVVAPQGGIVKGSSCVVLLSDAGAGRTLLKEKAWQHLQLSVPRGGSRPRYPNSPMGAVALLRQSMYDANWYREAWDAYRARGDLPRPETNLALDVLSKAIVADTFVIDAPNERMAIRA
jgi:imidazolonepropionase-like amidohydrolase